MSTKGFFLCSVFSLFLLSSGNILAQNQPSTATAKNSSGMYIGAFTGFSDSVVRGVVNAGTGFDLWGFVVGKNFSPFRVEAMFAYNGSAPYAGSYVLNSFINAYYDFHLSHSTFISFGLGAGIGYFGEYAANADFGYSAAGSQLRFNYLGSIGVSHVFKQDVTLSMTYRYMGYASSEKFASIPISKFSNNWFTIGLTYNF